MDLTPEQVAAINEKPVPSSSGLLLLISELMATVDRLARRVSFLETVHNQDTEDALVEWVNAAESEDIREIGVTAATTNRLVADRPFQTQEEIDGVRGVGETVLTRLINAAKASTS